MKAVMVTDKSDDALLAETLRKEEPDQFYTLVRMHLSFILDLNTDEFDASAEKTKFRPLKWGFPKKNKPKEPTETTILTAEAMERVFMLIEWLSEERNVTQEGIFRRSGKMTRQQELKNLLNSREPLILNDGRFSVHDGASVLKNVLAQLPECLLTEAHYPAHCQIAEMCNSSKGKISEAEEKRLLRALQLMLLLLPTENLSLLRNLMKLLHLTASHVAQNKMSADNLATLFTPHLLCPRRLTPEALHSNSQILSPVLSFMIMQGPTLFDVPTELATDIRANWARQEKGLDESVCDGLAAKTVFTFVDRERTAEASATTNPTEDALAQLYAHIQSLPESANKKRLIKHFNKQNGQGTPQLQDKGERASRSRQCYSGAAPRPRARSRSLGDSIKKHIPVFNKAPKRRKDGSEEPPMKEGRDSPASKVKKNLAKKSLSDVDVSEESSSSLNGNSGGTKMPTLKTSLMKLSTSGGESPSRVRLLANPKRTPLSVLTQNTLANSNTSCPSPKLSSSTSPGSALTLEQSKGSNPCRTSPTSTPFPAPLLPDQATVPHHLKRQSGSDVVWPVSTGTASVANASSTPAGLTNILTTPLNGVPWITSTPACTRVAFPLETNNLNSCLITPSNATGNSSMSPITQSTQKMPKAMQENMMTPRSRKPVVALSSSNLCQLAHLSGWVPSDTGELLRSATNRATNRATLLSDKNSRNLTRKLAMMHEESFVEAQNEQSVYAVVSQNPAAASTADADADGSNSCSGGDRYTCYTTGSQDDLNADRTQSKTCKCGNTCDKFVDHLSSSGESTSITGTFRDYLMSRSVLTASPVDLSFSSRTGDFDTSSDREMKMILSGDAMSNSLLYCLDGNRPEKMSCDSERSRVGDDCAEVLGNNSVQDEHFCSESESSGVETGTCFGSGSISGSRSLNNGHDSINTSSFTDKSLEKHSGLDESDANVAEDGLPNTLSDNCSFACASEDIRVNDVGAREGCLTNVSASFV